MGIATPGPCSISAQRRRRGDKRIPKADTYIMKLSAAQAVSMPTSMETIGRAVREGRDHKYTKAAKEVVSLDWSFPKLTGPPLNAKGLQKGFIDILI